MCVCNFWQNPLYLTRCFKNIFLKFILKYTEWTRLACTEPTYNAIKQPKYSPTRRIDTGINLSNWSARQFERCITLDDIHILRQVPS